MKKPEKITLVENLTTTLKGAPAVILVDYAGLSVKLQQKLKKELKPTGSKMFVAKNTFFKIAGDNAKFPKEILDMELLKGQTAIVTTGEDVVAPLQILAKFAKENEIPQFKVGVVEGSFQTKENLIKLSKLPAKEVLYAQVVGGIGAPLYGLVGTLQGNIQKLLYILKAKAETK
jgi:large subunit ribosomal protein L10